MKSESADNQRDNNCSKEQIDNSNNNNFTN